MLNTVATLLPPVKGEADDVLRVALIGRPNVGKSNLFNKLAGKQQAVVANIAGWRDINRVQINYHQRTIELLDTAGIKNKQESGIEKFSVLRTLQTIEESDICLLLMDVNELNTPARPTLGRHYCRSGQDLVIVVSKWDSVEAKMLIRVMPCAEISFSSSSHPGRYLFYEQRYRQNVTKLLI